MGTTVAGYIVLLSCYNQVYELAALLQTDVTTLNDHKYIAHHSSPCRVQHTFLSSSSSGPFASSHSGTLHPSQSAFYCSSGGDFILSEAFSDTVLMLLFLVCMFAEGLQGRAPKWCSCTKVSPSVARHLRCSKQRSKCILRTSSKKLKASRRLLCTKPC